MKCLKTLDYRTAGGVDISRCTFGLPLDGALKDIFERIDNHRGAVFASGYEYPGRYSRWDIGFADPPLELVAYQRQFRVTALNERGEVLLGMVSAALERHPHLEGVEISGEALRGCIRSMPAYFAEEERSKQPTIFSVLRALTHHFHSDQEKHLGFYGALGYDLVFQFEPIQLRQNRDIDCPDLHVFLPDELIVVDHRRELALRHSYDFACGGFRTIGLPRRGDTIVCERGSPTSMQCDHCPGEYADKVRQIIRGTKRGDFFEVVLSQVLSAGYAGTPCELFESIRLRNPSPYEFLINLGKEQLIGASPEMFVRVDGKRMETCPISGTIQRGASALDDAENIRELLNSAKDEAELTMCTDVDRNDKARVALAGSVEVIGRRMIEIYSRLIHTVDHVVGELREDCDGLDALLSHMWACTLTGSPKLAAMQRIEDLENSSRGWYGGCVGMLLFDGQVNTGITIRTVHLRDGLASVRAGATLLCDSEPDEEERETRTKAEAFIGAIMGQSAATAEGWVMPAAGNGKKVLFVDNSDSFVHTLGDYVRQTGADIVTVRAGFPDRVFDEETPDLVFISPGPGTPLQFGVPDLVRRCVDRRLPLFGVCLGMQGLVEAFGGHLGVLDYPMHGKASVVRCDAEGFLEGFPTSFLAARYHSLYAQESQLPDCLRVLARTEDGIIMAVEHRDYPAGAVQFHPESILTLKDDLGRRLISQVIARFAR